MPDMLKIDVHMHFYPSAELGLADKAYEVWEYGKWPDVAFGPYAGTVSDGIGSMNAAHVSRGVLLIYFMGRLLRRAAVAASDLAEQQCTLSEIDEGLRRRLEAGNCWGCDVAQRNPQIKTFVTVDPDFQSPQEAALHVCKMAEDHGAVGLKLHGAMQGFSMADERLWPTYAVCDRLRLPILGHAGPDREGQGYAEPEAFERLLDAFPRLPVILAHMGGACWKQTAGVAARHPNAYFDCSEIIQWTGSPNGPTTLELARLIREIGPDRVMMGSDFPWYDIDDTIEKVLQLPVLTAAEKEAILGANAVRILNFLR